LSEPKTLPTASKYPVSQVLNVSYSYGIFNLNIILEHTHVFMLVVSSVHLAFDNLITAVYYEAEFS